jgi:hypothetical protein
MQLLKVDCACFARFLCNHRVNYGFRRLHGWHYFAFLDEPRRVACHHRPGFDVFRGNRARADHRPLAHDDPRSDKRVRANPDLIADFNGRFEQRQIGFAIVVRAGAEMRPLGNGYILTDGHRAKVVNERAFANGAPVADAQVPGKIDYSRTVDMDLVSDLRAKQPENATAPAKERPRAEAKEQFAHAPEDAAQQFGPGVFRGLSISCNVESGEHGGEQ